MDYYEVLGVKSSATPDEVKRSYRKLARSFHPDVNPDAKAAERFKSISRAYDTLSDPAKRRAYDESLLPPAPPPFPPRTRGATRPRGANMSSSLEVSFREAARGASLPLRLRLPVTCQACQGTRQKPGTLGRLCPTCSGAGSILDSSVLSMLRDCKACNATGFVPSMPCTTCQGRGTVFEPRTLTLVLPAGIGSGQRVRLPGRGAPGTLGGAPGDLLVTITVRPDPALGRVGLDITRTSKVPFGLLALGGTTSVETLDGPAKLKVPPGTPSGRTFRLKGFGAGPPDKRGDLLVSLVVEVPLTLTDAQRDLLLKLDI